MILGYVKYTDNIHHRFFFIAIIIIVVFFVLLLLLLPLQVRERKELNIKLITQKVIRAYYL